MSTIVVGLIFVLGMSAMLAMVLSMVCQVHDIDPKEWFKDKDHDVFIAKAVITHRLEQISQDPEWLERIETEGPSVLYLDLVNTVESSYTGLITRQQSRSTIYQCMKRSGLVSKRYLK